MTPSPTDPPRGRLRFNAFTMNCVSHIHHGQWRRSDTRQLEYASLAPWLELAQLLERGRFDAIFLADVIGTYDSYRGSRDPAVLEGLQIPVNDPALLIPAMAAVTSDIGFAFTHSVLQEHPFAFARKVGTLDHLTEGRVDGARTQIADVRGRALAAGRQADDILFYQGLSVIVGGTEEEARRKEAEIDAHASDEGYAAHMAGNLGVDLSAIDLDTPVGDLPEAHVRGIVRSLVEAAPDRTWRFGDLLRYITDLRVVGTPEQVADELARWSEAGVDGINLVYHTTPGSFRDFVDGVTPVLRQRGLQQREYRDGTLREKLTARGPRLPERHPAAAHRRSPVPVA